MNSAVLSCSVFATSFIEAESEGEGHGCALSALSVESESPQKHLGDRCEHELFLLQIKDAHIQLTSDLRHVQPTL